MQGIQLAVMKPCGNMITIKFKRKRKWFLTIGIFLMLQCNYRPSAHALMYIPGNTSSAKLHLYCVTI